MSSAVEPVSAMTATGIRIANLPSSVSVGTEYATVVPVEVKPSAVVFVFAMIAAVTAVSIAVALPGSKRAIISPIAIALPSLDASLARAAVIVARSPGPVVLIVTSTPPASIKPAALASAAW